MKILSVLIVSKVSIKKIARIKNLDDVSFMGAYDATETTIRQANSERHMIRSANTAFTGFITTMSLGTNNIFSDEVVS